MATKYGKKKSKHSVIIYSIITAFLLITVFLNMISYFYTTAEEEAYETLHIQTKQIKDDLTLQIKSDRENLITMANFAAKLYADGQGFDSLFESFKPIGLFSNIGILMPNNIFISKKFTLDLNGQISFEDELKRGEYISGRVADLSREGEEIIKSAVPIMLNDKCIGILYGVILPHTINNRYNRLAQDLNAQLFVYEKSGGNLIIHTTMQNLENISFLKDREYSHGYSYEQLINTDKGYSSFKSIYKDEDLYIHYSAIEDFNWGIILGRYESNVFSKAHKVSQLLLASFLTTLFIIVLYLFFIFKNEKSKNIATACSSQIRKQLLEINQTTDSLYDALKNITEFLSSRSSFFVDTDGEEFVKLQSAYSESMLDDDDRSYFTGELLHYAAKFHDINKATVGYMYIKPNKHLYKTNKDLYDFMNEHKFKAVAFSSVTDKNNHVSLLGVVNPQKLNIARKLLEDVAVCFSIAIFNKKHLNRTELAATTDSLTGVLNRVSFKKDILIIDEEKPLDFSCMFVDVNELHLRNNKYGHAAGDEMLIYIANTLKEVFFGHLVYRMGGDEFLVFAKDTTQEHFKNLVDTFIKHLETTDYKVAIGVSFRSQNTNSDEMVREAEIRMYEAKAEYYQNKEKNTVSKDADEGYVQVKTGIREIDTMISVLKENYNGIYRVSLDSDKAHRILMPSYLGYDENEDNFSKLFKKYVNDIVHPDFHRAMMSFVNYDAIKRQLTEGSTPKITYKKVNGETVILSVYNLEESTEIAKDTLWVFAKE